MSLLHVWRKIWRIADTFPLAVVLSRIVFARAFASLHSVTSVAELLRKLSLTSLVLFFDAGTPLQVFFALLLSAYSHVAHAHYRPFIDPAVFKLQHFSLLTTTVSWLCGYRWLHSHFALSEQHMTHARRCDFMSKDVPRFPHSHAGQMVYALGLLFKVGAIKDSAASASQTGLGADKSIVDALGWVLVVMVVTFLVASVVVGVRQLSSEIRRQQLIAGSPALRHITRAVSKRVNGKWRGGGGLGRGGGAAASGAAAGGAVQALAGRTVGAGRRRMPPRLSTAIETETVDVEGDTLRHLALSPQSQDTQQSWIDNPLSPATRTGGAPHNPSDAPGRYTPKTRRVSSAGMVVLDEDGVAVRDPPTTALPESGARARAAGAPSRAATAMKAQVRRGAARGKQHEASRTEPSHSDAAGGANRGNAKPDDAATAAAAPPAASSGGRGAGASDMSKEELPPGWSRYVTRRCVERGSVRSCCSAEFALRVLALRAAGGLPPLTSNT